ncbi:MAG: GNAT family N-acetyltransferase [Patescibacteria group bacterium]
MRLIGSKIALRPLTLRDLPNCWKWIRDREVTRYMSGAQFPKTYVGEVKWFKNMKKKKDELLFAMLDKKSGQHIGTFGIHSISQYNKKATVGIMIGEKEFWGRGYGTDAMTTALAYCFKKLKLNKVSLLVVPQNKGAMKCYKKCGFKKVGFIKDESRGVDGKFHDAYLMDTFA